MSMFLYWAPCLAVMCFGLLEVYLRHVRREDGAMTPLKTKITDADIGVPLKKTLQRSGRRKGGGDLRGGTV